MTLGIRCDRIDAETFRRCDAELWGMAFNAKPADWTVVDLGFGDHRDYCPRHAPRGER